MIRVASQLEVLWLDLLFNRFSYKGMVNFIKHLRDTEAAKDHDVHYAAWTAFLREVALVLAQPDWLVVPERLSLGRSCTGDDPDPEALLQLIIIAISELKFELWDLISFVELGIDLIRLVRLYIHHRVLLLVLKH